jgi:hypothetical protein
VYHGRKEIVKFTGELVVPAPRETVFEKLCDARFFASCVDGVSNLNEVDATHYTAVLETRVAYIKFKFNVAVEITDMQPPERVVVRAEGAPIGMVGRLTATSVAELKPQGNHTLVSYEIDAALAGKLGSIGQPVMKSKAKEMERQFAANIRAAFDPAATEKKA